MVYSVIIPFCTFGGGGCQEKNNIIGKSSISVTMMFCGGASGARERRLYKDNQNVMGTGIFPHKRMYLRKYSHLQASRVVLIRYVAGPLP